MKSQLKVAPGRSVRTLGPQENQAENARLHQHLKHLQESSEHYQAATQQLRQEQVLLIEKQKSEYDQQLSQLRSQLELMTVEKSNYQAQCTQLNKINEGLETEQKTLVLQNKEIAQQYLLLKITGDKIQEDYAQLSNAHQKQSLNLENKNHTVIELQLKLKSSNEKIALIERALSSADTKVHNLRNEHQFTSQEKANLEGQLKQLQNIVSAKTGALIG
jgi:chromosome segregation ATPase